MLYIVIASGMIAAFEVEVGIDIEAPMIGDQSQIDFFQNNRDKGKLFPTYSEYHFNRKIILTFDRWLTTGSITLKILVDTNECHMAQAYGR